MGFQPVLCNLLRVPASISQSIHAKPNLLHWFRFPSGKASLSVTVALDFARVGSGQDDAHLGGLRDQQRNLRLGIPLPASCETRQEDGAAELLLVIRIPCGALKRKAETTIMHADVFRLPHGSRFSLVAPNGGGVLTGAAHLRRLHQHEKLLNNSRAYLQENFPAWERN